MLAGIYGNATAFRAVVGSGPNNVMARADFPVSTPDQTLDKVTRFIREQGEVTAVGVACFGPLDLNPKSPTYGHITSSLKPAWRDYDLGGAVRQGLPVDITLDVDVNSAALGEWSVGAGKGMRSVAFVWVGGGTGVGAAIDGRPLRGRAHPEMGHLPVARHASDRFPGQCPYHGDCFEGLVSPAALADRGLSPMEEAQLAAFYLAQLTTALTYVLSPEVIVLDGPVLAMPGMLPAVRTATNARLGNDPNVSPVTTGGYLVASTLDGPGVLGTLLLPQGKDIRS